MTKVYSALELENFINNQDQIVILHNIDGEVWGASHEATEVFGYTQSEIKQLYLSNLKAKTLRLADVIKDEEDNKEKLVWEQRNGHRFCAFVTSKLIHAMVFRQEIELFSLTLEVINPTGRIADIKPDINILDIQKYLNAYQKEIQAPLMQLNDFSHKFQHLNNSNSDNIEQPAAQLQDIKEQIQHSIYNIIDSFKLIVNDFNLDNQPFNIINKIGEYGAHWCQFYKIISLFVDKTVPELVYGDEKKLHVILDNILYLANEIFKPSYINIDITNTPMNQSDNNDKVKNVEMMQFSLKIIHCQFSKNKDINNNTKETRNKIDQFNQSSSLFLTKSLVHSMSGNINTHIIKNNNNSNTDIEINFTISLPEVDNLGVENNRNILKEKDIFLLDFHDSSLTKQLQSFSAQVHHFKNSEQFLSNLEAIDINKKSCLIIINIPSTDNLQPIFIDKSIFEWEHFKQIPTLLIKPVDYFLTGKGHILKISAPYQPATLGNVLSQIVQKDLPYPYSHQQLNRRELPHDKIANLLLVQSEPTISEAFILQLNSIGYHVEIAVNGIDALLACSGWKYDCVMIDNNIPLMNGIELASHLKNNFKSYQDTFIVLLLDKYNEDKKVIMEELNLTHYLTKPISQMSLLKTMNIGITQCQNKKIEKKETSKSDKTKKASNLESSLLKNQSFNINPPLSSDKNGEDLLDKNNLTTLDTVQSNYVDEQAIERLINDTTPDITRQMIDLFIEESYISLGKLENCIELGKWQDVHVYAQEITASSITFGCTALHDLAIELINESNQNNLSECLKLTGKLSQIFLQSQTDLYRLASIQG